MCELRRKGKSYCSHQSNNKRVCCCCCSRNKKRERKERETHPSYSSSKELNVVRGSILRRRCGSLSCYFFFFCGLCVVLSHSRRLQLFVLLVRCAAKVKFILVSTYLPPISRRRQCFSCIIIPFFCVFA